MRPASIGPFSGQQGSAGWQQWVSDAIRQIIDYSQQPFISLTGDVTSKAGGAQIATTIAGGSKLINTLTVSGTPANLQDTTSLTGSFSSYQVIFENLVPVTNAVGLRLLVHSGGSFQNTTYVNSVGGATTYIDLTNGAGVGNSAGMGLSGTVILYNVNSTIERKHLTGTVAWWLSPTFNGAQPAGLWNGGAGAVDGIEVLFSSGNIASGSVRIYGLP